MRYFFDREWIFKRDRVSKLWENLAPTDKELFFFDITQLSWERYTPMLLLGLRVYLLKDDICTLPTARRKWKRFDDYESETNL